MQGMKTLALIICILVSSTANAAGSSFYEKKGEGWFWYAEPPAPQEDPEHSEKETDTPQPTEPVSEPEAGPETLPLPPLSVAWFQENLTKTLHKAIDNPTESNIRAYYVLHKIMTEKSHVFAEKSRLVAIKNPVLSNLGGRTGSNAQVTRVQKFKKEITETIGNRLRRLGGGLIFFHDNSEFSVQLATSMEKLARFDGIDVKGVRVTPEKLSGRAAHLFQDARYAPHLPRQIGLTNIPSVALAIPPAHPVILVDGMATRDEITRRIAILSKEANLISKDEYEKFMGRNPGSAPIKITNDDLINIDVDDPESIIALEKLLEDS